MAALCSRARDTPHQRPPCIRPQIYLAEIAPAQIRAKVVGTSVTWSASGVLFGQLISYLVNQRPDG